jgi:hypothetical protein
MPKDDGIFEPQEGFTDPQPSPFAIDEGEDAAFASLDEPAGSKLSGWRSDPPRSGFRDAEPSRVTPPSLPPQARASAPAESTPPKPAPEPVAAVEQPPPSVRPATDPMRQLELRAIFGVGHVMAHEEILHHCGKLPGVSQIKRVDAGELTQLSSLRQFVRQLGLDQDEPIALVQGQARLEFIQEGGVLLAVRTEGGFAPGVREALILVARELGRPL